MKKYNMSKEKKIFFINVFILALMTILNIIILNIADFKILNNYLDILFYGINTISCIIVGIIAGKNIKKCWWMILGILILPLVIYKILFIKLNIYFAILIITYFEFSIISAMASWGIKKKSLKYSTFVLIFILLIVIIFFQKDNVIVKIKNEIKNEYEIYMANIEDVKNEEIKVRIIEIYHKVFNIDSIEFYNENGEILSKDTVKIRDTVYIKNQDIDSMKKHEFLRCDVEKEYNKFIELSVETYTEILNINKKEIPIIKDNSDKIIKFIDLKNNSRITIINKKKGKLFKKYDKIDNLTNRAKAYKSNIKLIKVIEKI